MEIIQTLTNPQTLITAVGTFGVIAIVFLETGVFFGFFFPGDSLLFTAGFLASQGFLSMSVLLIGTFMTAVVGDNVGYAMGRRIGPSLFTREDSIFFNKKHLIRAQKFFEKHGKKTIILARFIPIVRTFAPLVAGMGNMDYKTFFAFNVIGGFFWTWSMLWLGFGLGSFIPDPDRYILPIVAIIILVSFIPPVLGLFRKQKEVL